MKLCVCGHSFKDHNLPSGGCSKCKPTTAAYVMSKCGGFRDPEIAAVLKDASKRATRILLTQRFPNRSVFPLIIRERCPGCTIRPRILGGRVVGACSGRIRCYI